MYRKFDNYKIIRSTIDVEKRELWGSKISPQVHCLRQFYSWVHIQLSFLRTSTRFTPSVR